MDEKRQETKTVNSLMRVEDAAQFLGVKTSYVYRMIRDRKIPHYKSRGGKLIYFRKEDLEAWMMGCFVEPQSSVEATAEKRSISENWL